MYGVSKGHLSNLSNYVKETEAPGLTCRPLSPLLPLARVVIQVKINFYILNPYLIPPFYLFLPFFTFFSRIFIYEYIAACYQKDSYME